MAAILSRPQFFNNQKTNEAPNSWHVYDRNLPLTKRLLVRYAFSWWRHQVETFSALLAICAGNSPVHGESPASDTELWCFLWCAPNKQLNKQWWGWWFETLSPSLWRHRNVILLRHDWFQIIGCVLSPHPSVMHKISTYSKFVLRYHLKENHFKLQIVYEFLHFHYNDVTMGSMTSQITSLTIVYSAVYSDTDQRKHQSSASLAIVRGIHRHKWPVTRKCFH